MHERRDGGALVAKAPAPQRGARRGRREIRVSTVEEDWREAVANQDAGNDETSTSRADTGKFDDVRKVMMGTAGIQSFVQEAQNANTDRMTMGRLRYSFAEDVRCTAEQLDCAR